MNMDPEINGILAEIRNRRYNIISLTLDIPLQIVATVLACALIDWSTDALKFPFRLADKLLDENQEIWVRVPLWSKE